MSCRPPRGQKGDRVSTQQPSRCKECWGGGWATFRLQLPFAHYWLNKQPWGKGVEDRAAR